MCLRFVGEVHLSEDRSIRKVKKDPAWLTESSPANDSIFEDLTTGVVNIVYHPPAPVLDLC